MRILALDTCLAACSVAIWRDGHILAHEWQPMQRGHAEALLPMLERVRIEAGLEYAGFDRLAVSIGPGSFAGVRTGLAAARGVCAARSLPLTGVNTLELLAAAIWEDDRLAIAIDARNDQVYFQAFDGASAICPPALLTLSQAAEFIRRTEGDNRLAGSGATVLAARCGSNVRVSHENLLPDAAILAGLAAHREAVAGDHVAPLYLRAPDARLPVTPA
ncbi:MAG: tRNA (adenosine(37)-N6)-threonylcarbamoyltransferase complex dimerization subunit type 1 TsaB [Alphaproteobacteria bacterium]